MLILLVIALISAVAVALVIRSERDEMIESYSTYRYISERKVSGLEENKERLKVVLHNLYFAQIVSPNFSTLINRSLVGFFIF